MSDSIDWQVESLRITAFPEEISEVSAENMWKQCIGIEPDETRIQRGGIETREAEYENGHIFLIRQVDRIDWRYHARQEDEDGPLKLPIIGSLKSELDVVMELAKSWINSTAVFQTSRLAFGAVLLYPVESVQDGYDVLRTLLPSLDLKNVKDFNYQVNRPRKSTVLGGVTINRLARWNVIRHQFLATNFQLIAATDELTHAD